MRLISYGFFCLFLISTGYSSVPGYFQQYVRYDITVHLDVATHKLDATETLLYTNHSEDTLHTIYFHLYMNKYRRNSLAYPDSEEDRGWIDITRMTENDSLQDQFTIDQTLMQIRLYDALPPGHSVRFFFEYVVQLPPASGRYGYMGTHHDVGNWFVTPVVYDRYGWHLHQHIDNEFFQEWGDFYVDIFVPPDFTVGATGNLLSSHTYLNKAKNPAGLMRAGTLDMDDVCWSYEAKKVHDFAWTTDPAYRLFQTTWNGITLNVLALDYNSESWEQVTDWGMEAVQYFHENFGPYPYDQITVADTYIRAGGIEYPQLVMINDQIDPDYAPGDFKAVVLHEIAHNWFYGILANNQTEEEWMDEGFTTYAEIKAMEALFGVTGNMNPGDRGALFRLFGYQDDDRLQTISSYLNRAKYHLIDDPIDIHADLLGADGYILQYAKTAAVLFMLENIMGDSLFFTGLQEYYDIWKFKHPYSQDFFKVMETVYGAELDWFVEQWLKTNRQLDIAVTDVDGEWQNKEGIRKYYGNIQLERRGQIAMPFDLDIFLRDGTILHYRVPLDTYEPVKTGRNSLPAWYQKRDTYNAELVLDQEIDYIIIDPEKALLDVNRLNNDSRFWPRQEFYFMRFQSAAPPLDAYLWEIWPDLFFNDIDKIYPGINLSGGYMNIDDLIDLGVWIKVPTSRVDFDLNYTTPVGWLPRITHIRGRLFRLDGRQGFMLGMGRNLLPKARDDYLIESGFRVNKLFDDRYPAGAWDNEWVSTYFVQIDWNQNHQYSYRTQQQAFLYLHTSVFNQTYRFSQVYGYYTRNFWDGYSDWALDFRLFAGYSEGDLPLQHLFGLSGDNGWGEFQERFYRSRGSLPIQWKRDGHLYKKGGANIRGYTAEKPDALVMAKKSLAVNLDLTIPNPVRHLDMPMVADLTPFGFFDYGSVWNEALPPWDEFFTSAGFGLHLELPSILGFVWDVDMISFEFPIWVKDRGNYKNPHWQVRLDFIQN